MVSKNHLDFFPSLSKNIPQDLQFLNIVTHGSVLPAQVKYIYDNDKYHGSTAKHPRNEHRINLNKHVNPDKKIFLKNDIVVIKKDSFTNEDLIEEEAYVITRFRKSIDSNAYDFVQNILENNSLSKRSENYCYAKKSDLLEIRKYNERLFKNIFPKGEVIIPIAEKIFDLQSKEGKDLGKRLLQKDSNEMMKWERQMRRIIFEEYNHMCAITRIGFNWTEFNKKTNKMDLSLSYDKGIEGAHIRPRSHNGGYTQDNIIPLIAPVHKLFDRGLFTLNNNLQVD